jgi:DNA replication and repair protein RecF
VPDVVLVVGVNGAGKTNLLESIHVGTQGFSPRTRSDAQLVHFGESAARIAVAGVRGDVNVELEVTLRTSEAKRAKLNGALLPNAERLRSEIATLVFTPDRLAVVKGGPAARRAYFDRVLGRLAPARAQLPVEYGAALAQRNAALRRIAGGFSSRDALDPWTQRVAQLASALVEARLEAIALLQGPFAAYAEELGLEDVRLAYDGEAPREEDLEARLTRDLERGTTGLGPHLDDVKITAGSRDLRTFGSQGEQRLTVLALLLAEARLLEEQRGEVPLLLFDDVLSELDAERRQVLVRLLPAGGQTVITATTASALPVIPAQVVEVRHGEARTAA